MCFIGNDTIYWTDMGFNKISRAKRDQTWKEDIVTNGLGRVEGIAVDWIAGRSGPAPELAIISERTHLLFSSKLNNFFSFQF